MDRVLAGRVRVRAALLWLTVTAALTGLGTLTAPAVQALAQRPGPTFVDALVQACAVAALVAGVLLWLATTEVVTCVLRSGGLPSRRAAGPVRLALLAACGAGVLATAAPAHAGDGGTPVGAGTPLRAEALAGLPLPDRATASRPREVVATAVVVRPGDSLWTIAARRLGPTASPAEVASYWLRVRALNTAALGPDPDLIQPGQTLRLPPA